MYHTRSPFVIWTFPQEEQVGPMERDPIKRLGSAPWFKLLCTLVVISSVVIVALEANATTTRKVRISSVMYYCCHHFLRVSVSCLPLSLTLSLSLSVVCG